MVSGPFSTEAITSPPTTALTCTLSLKLCSLVSLKVLATRQPIVSSRSSFQIHRKTARMQVMQVQSSLN